MKNTAKRITALLFAFLIVFLTFAAGASALLVTGDSFAVEIDGATDEITVGSQLQLTATITVPADSELDEDDFEIEWESEFPDFATVDDDGKVTAKAIGKTTITATVEDPDGFEKEASYVVYCIRKENAIHNKLENKAILGYRYHYADDYYYTDDRDCWQSKFGFLNAFDLVCPYILLEYDYIRTHFDYGDRSWMIQLWKGQYGMVFYGSEIGVYCREKLAPDEEITAFTHYDCCVSEYDRLGMEMTLYWDENNDGNYVYQFSRPYDKYWWCTGFKSGHLWQTEPASELRMVSRIDLKDEEMADAFTAALENCGFRRSDNLNRLPLDSFHQDGATVNLTWQNISEAESSVVVKATLGSLIATGSFGAIFILLAFMALSFFSMIFFFVL